MTLTLINKPEIRIDLFTFTNKAIRSILFVTTSQLQSINFACRYDREEAVHIVKDCLTLLNQRREHEDKIVFPSIEKVKIGITAEFENEQLTYCRKVLELQNIVDQLVETPSVKLGQRLGNEILSLFKDFVVFYLIHLDSKEKRMLSVSQKYLSNEELLCMHRKIHELMLLHLPLNIGPFKSRQMINFKWFSNEKESIHRITDCRHAQGV